jgi:hypothetical protein
MREGESSAEGKVAFSVGNVQEIDGLDQSVVRASDIQSSGSRCNPDKWSFAQ